MTGVGRGDPDRALRGAERAGARNGPAAVSPPRPPILLRAIRDLFAGEQIGAGAAGAARPAALTDAAYAELSGLVSRTAANGGRSLVFLDGPPCSGKSLLGLRLVHSRTAPAPAVYLSGNASLAEIMQYELRRFGSASGAPVRSLKDFVRQYAGKQAWVPPHHVIVVDDVQPLSPDEQVAAKHGTRPARSDPDTLIGLAERIPEWSVLVVVTGDKAESVLESHEVRPDAAADAVESRPDAAAGSVEAACSAADERERWRAAAGRSRSAAEWVVHDLRLEEPLRPMDELHRPLRVLRDLDEAKRTLRDRSAGDVQARFGLLASSRDQDLVHCGVANDPDLTGRPGLLGPWACDGDASRRSGRHLEQVVTEFGVRGLELDAALVAWGTDLARVNGVWVNTHARAYARSARVNDPLRLRRNAYRLLLSRGIDETVVFVPPRPGLDETATYLSEAGLAGL